MNVAPAPSLEPATSPAPKPAPTPKPAPVPLAVALSNVSPSIDRLEAQRIFVERIEELADRQPRDQSFQEDILALLKFGYDHDLEILAPGRTDYSDLSTAKQGNVTLKDGSKYLLCVTHFAYGMVFARAGLRVQDLMIRDVIDRVLYADVYNGLLFDYKAPSGQFIVFKEALRKVIGHS